MMRQPMMRRPLLRGQEFDILRIVISLGLARANEQRARGAIEWRPAPPCWSFC